MQSQNIFVDNVLIDTWWNVNEEIKSEVKIDDTSFNRYMVECECY